MNGRVWCQKGDIFGWVKEPDYNLTYEEQKLPTDISKLDLTLDVNKSRRFDVDNNFRFMKMLLDNGFVLTVAGSIIENTPEPSSAPFTSNTIFN